MCQVSSPTENAPTSRARYFLPGGLFYTLERGRDDCFGHMNKPPLPIFACGVEVRGSCAAGWELQWFRGNTHPRRRLYRLLNVFAHWLGERIWCGLRQTQTGSAVHHRELKARASCGGTDVNAVSVRSATNEVNVLQGMVSSRAALPISVADNPRLLQCLRHVPSLQTVIVVRLIMKSQALLVRTTKIRNTKRMVAVTSRRKWAEAPEGRHVRSWKSEWCSRQMEVKLRMSQVVHVCVFWRGEQRLRL